MCQKRSAELNSFDSLSYVTGQGVTGPCDCSKYRGPHHSLSCPHNGISMAPNSLVIYKDLAFWFGLKRRQSL